MNEFQFVVALSALMFISISVYRYRILHFKTPHKNHEEYCGELYAVGKSVVAYKKASQQEGEKPRTIICMHGWLEDHRYFSELYKPQDGELIFINSCDYHAPVKNKPIKNASWQALIPFDECTIEYDAAVLIQAVENLSSHHNILLHGHSRGGAVVIEAIKQAPQLFAEAQVILEAPILPEAPVSKFHNLPKWLDIMASKAILLVFPFLVYRLAKSELSYSTIKKMGPVNERKTHLLQGLLFSAKSAGVLMRNVKNMLSWPLQNRMDILGNVKGGYILLGARDSVLSKRLMLRSANRAGSHLQVIQTKNSSHFISLDIPSEIKSLDLS